MRPLKSKPHRRPAAAITPLSPTKSTRNGDTRYRVRSLAFMACVCPESRAYRAATSANAWYSAVFPTFSAAAASRTLSPAAIIPWARSRTIGVITLGRPFLRLPRSTNEPDPQPACKPAAGLNPASAAKTARHDAPHHPWCRSHRPANGTLLRDA
jgi:hypothetical protein